MAGFSRALDLGSCAQLVSGNFTTGDYCSPSSLIQVVKFYFYFILRLRHTLPDGLRSKYGVSLRIFTRWITIPFLIRTVPFAETCTISYGPALGADIFLTLPGSSSSTLSPTLYVCGIRLRFSCLLDLFMMVCLRNEIAAQLALNSVGRIMSRPNTSWPGVACSVVWHVLRLS